MADEHLRGDHHKIIGTYEFWWYEEPAGIRLCSCDKLLLIRWSAIRAALARKDKPSGEQKGDK